MKRSKNIGLRQNCKKQSTRAQQEGIINYSNYSNSSNVDRKRGGTRVTVWRDQHSRPTNSIETTGIPKLSTSHCFTVLYNINYSTPNEYKLCFNKAILTSSLEYHAQFEINDRPWLPVALWLIVRLLTVRVLFAKRLAAHEHRLHSRGSARDGVLSVVISDFSRPYLLRIQTSSC